MTNAQAYFNQTQLGESRWWSWLAGTWFFVVGAMIVQTFIAGPIPTVAEVADPEAVKTYNETAARMFETLDMKQFALFGSLTALFAILGGLGWLLNRTLSGTASKVFGIFAGIGMLGSTIAMFNLYPMLNDPDVNSAFMALIGTSAIAYALMLLTFPASLIGLYLVQKFLHKRTITSLHTAAAHIDWRRIIFAIAITWAVLGTLSALMHFSGYSALRMTFDPSRFFTYAIVTLLFIPLQSGTEEIVFRGYFNQGLGHFISNKWVVFIITSVMFAAMHLSNPESVSGAEKGGFTHLLVMSQYFLFGFILCIVVYQEGGLEAAIGVHAGNNMFAAMFVNYEGSVLPTPSMFISTPNPQTDAIGGIIVLGIIAYILHRTRKDRIKSIG